MAQPGPAEAGELRPGRSALQSYRAGFLMGRSEFLAGPILPDSQRIRYVHVLLYAATRVMRWRS